MKIKDKYKGIFYIILAAFGFAFMNLFVKLAGDLPAIEKSFFRNLVAVFFAFTVMKKEKIPFTIPKGTGKYIFSGLCLGQLGSLQTSMPLESCILRMHPCLISCHLFLPSFFLIFC